MVPNIPVATDHIYKFVALFGLVMMISGWLGTAYIVSNYNERYARSYVDIEIAKGNESASIADNPKIKPLERRLSRKDV